MFKNVLYKAYLLVGACLTFTACSQEDDLQAVGSDGVSIQVRIADAAATRATEDGWDGDWNENAVTRLDLSNLPQMAS